MSSPYTRCQKALALAFFFSFFSQSWANANPIKVAVGSSALRGTFRFSPLTRKLSDRHHLAMRRHKRYETEIQSGLVMQGQGWSNAPQALEADRALLELPSHSSVYGSPLYAFDLLPVAELAQIRVGQRIQPRNFSNVYEVQSFYDFETHYKEWIDLHNVRWVVVQYQNAKLWGETQMAPEGHATFRFNSYVFPRLSSFEVVALHATPEYTIIQLEEIDPITLEGENLRPEFRFSTDISLSEVFD